MNIHSTPSSSIEHIKKAAQEGRDYAWLPGHDVSWTGHYTPKQSTLPSGTQFCNLTTLTTACLGSTPHYVLRNGSGNPSTTHLADDYTLLLSACALHRADALRTHVRAIIRNGADGTRPGQDIVFRQLNDNLHYTALYTLKALISIVICVMLWLSLLATLQYATSPSIDAIRYLLVTGEYSAYL